MSAQVASLPRPPAGSKNPRISIRNRILILALMIIVPLMGDRVRLLADARSERVARAVAEVADLAERGAEAQSRTIEAARSLLQVVGHAYVKFLPSGEACTEFLSGFTHEVPWITGLFIVGGDSRISCSTRRSAVGLDVSDREYIQQAQQKGGFVLSESIVGRIRAEPEIMASYAVTGPDGNALAVIAAPIELRWVSQFSDLIEDRPGASAVLIDGHGVVVAERPDRGNKGRQDISDHPLIRAALAQQRGTVTQAGPDGVRRIYGFYELPGTNAHILVGIDEHEVLGRIDRDISFAYLELAVAGLIALLAAQFLGERLFLRPIRSLTRTAGSIGRGDMETAPPRDVYTAEFAPLAAALTEMAKQLAARERELRTANQHLEELALLDGLSGLPNRRSFDMRLATSWHAADPELPISLLMVDVDHFKLFNDSHGHVEGDNCLRLIGETLAAELRETEFVARYGGEEFVVLLAGVDGAEACSLAERLRRAVERRGIRHGADKSGLVSVSVGIATFRPSDSKSPSALIEAADAALYEAKRRGRNIVSVWSPRPLAKAS